MIRKQLITIAVIFLLLGSGNISYFAAQTRPLSDVKYKLAQSYERSGDIETAVKLYEEIFTADSTNPVVLDALKRIYLQLKRYDEAITLIEHSLRKYPDDISLLAQLGSTYTLKSDEPRAFEIWDRAIKVSPNNETTYRVVCSAVTQSRLFDHAIELYKRGRTACNNPALFISDIAYLYSITLNYSEATREYVHLLRQNPGQLGLVQGSISLYTGRADGLSAATHVVEEAVKSEPDNLVFRQVLAWLYMEGLDHERAYGVYQFLDQKLNANGRELFNFAERAHREKAYTAAKKAYRNILDNYPKSDLAAQVKFGYAMTLEESIESPDTLRLFGGRSPFVTSTDNAISNIYAEPLEAYQRVISEYPNTEIAARSLYRTAIIRQEKTFDLDGAGSSLEILITSYSRFTAVAAGGRFQLGEVYLAQNDIPRAQSQYKSLSDGGATIPYLRDRAMLRLAEIDYFTGNFQGAITRLQPLTANPSADVTNDALGLKFFIEENVTSSEDALGEFSRADLLRRQRKLSESLRLFQSIVATFPASNVIDEALMSAGDIQTEMHRYADALSTYRDLTTTQPESILLDRTIMKTGQIYQFGLNDAVRAVESYQQLLEKFPNSVFANEARRSIRSLRGDSI